MFSRLLDRRKPLCYMIESSKFYFRIVQAGAMNSECMQQVNPQTASLNIHLLGQLSADKTTYIVPVSSAAGSQGHFSSRVVDVMCIKQARQHFPQLVTAG